MTLSQQADRVAALCEESQRVGRETIALIEEHNARSLEREALIRRLTRETITQLDALNFTNKPNKGD